MKLFSNMVSLSSKATVSGRASHAPSSLAPHERSGAPSGRCVLASWWLFLAASVFGPVFAGAVFVILLLFPLIVAAA